MSKYDPDKCRNESKFVVKEGVEMISWWDMAMRFTKRNNKLLFAISAVGTCSFGLVRPGFAIFIGRMSDGVGSAGSDEGFG